MFLFYLSGYCGGHEAGTAFAADAEDHTLKAA
jgi:hypothetical protein